MNAQERVKSLNASKKGLSKELQLLDHMILTEPTSNYGTLVTQNDHAIEARYSDVWENGRAHESPCVFWSELPQLPGISIAIFALHEICLWTYAKPAPVWTESYKQQMQNGSWTLCDENR
jgi:hypothetical protein